jgi:hypothetical protein
MHLPLLIKCYTSLCYHQVVDLLCSIPTVSEYLPPTSGKNTACVCGRIRDYLPDERYLLSPCLCCFISVLRALIELYVIVDNNSSTRMVYNTQNNWLTALCPSS